MIRNRYLLSNVLQAKGMQKKQESDSALLQQHNSSFCVQIDQNNFQTLSQQRLHRVTSQSFPFSVVCFWMLLFLLSTPKRRVINNNSFVLELIMHSRLFLCYPQEAKHRGEKQEEARGGSRLIRSTPAQYCYLVYRPRKNKKQSRSRWDLNADK